MKNTNKYRQTYQKYILSKDQMNCKWLHSPLGSAELGWLNFSTTNRFSFSLQKWVCKFANIYKLNIRSLQTVQTTAKQLKSYLVRSTFLPVICLGCTQVSRPKQFTRRRRGSHLHKTQQTTHSPTIEATILSWHSWNDKNRVGKQKFHTRKKNAQRTSWHLFEMKNEIFSFQFCVLLLYRSNVNQSNSKTHLKALY